MHNISCITSTPDTTARRPSCPRTSATAGCSGVRAAAARTSSAPTPSCRCAPARVASISAVQGRPCCRSLCGGRWGCHSGGHPLLRPPTSPLFACSWPPVPRRVAVPACPPLVQLLRPDFPDNIGVAVLFHKGPVKVPDKQRRWLAEACGLRWGAGRCGGHTVLATHRQTQQGCRCWLPAPTNP